MRLIFWVNGWLVRILCVLAVLVIAIMALGVSAEVILRMFNFPSIMGLIELTEYGLFISTFFMAPHLLRTNEHVRVDIAMSRAGPATARIVEYFVLGAIITVCVITGAISTSMLLTSGRITRWASVDDQSFFRKLRSMLMRAPAGSVRTCS